jgi:hypothetical protein
VQDYIPPVAYRLGGVDVDYQHFEEGAFILFVEGVRELREIESGKRGVPLERLLSDTRMLVSLSFQFVVAYGDGSSKYPPIPGVQEGVRRGSGGAFL